MQQPALVGFRTPPLSSSAWHDCRVALVAGVMLLAWDVSGLDLTIARLFGGAAGFPLQDHWVTHGLLYNGIRYLGWLVAISMALSVFVARQSERLPARRDRIWALATSLLCLLVIPLIRNTSSTSCPWSLAEFGGTAIHISHWTPWHYDGGPGRCFPSGHSSAGFAFLAGAFALRRTWPAAARAWLLGAVAIGFVASVTQIVRGAHFVSHSLWTAWICWTLASCAFHLTRAWRERIPKRSLQAESAVDVAAG